MKEITKYYIRLFMLLFPVLFLPVVLDAYGVGKNILIMGMVGLGLLLWVVEMVINKKDEIKFNTAFVWVLMLVILAMFSWWKLPLGSRMNAVMLPMGVGTLMAVAGWMFLWLQVSTKEESDKQINWMTISTVIVGLVSVVVFLVPASKMPILLPNKDNPLLSISSGWSMTGSLVAEVILMLFLLVEWAKRLMTKVRNGEFNNYIVEAVIAAFLTLVAGLDLYKIYKLGWVVLDLNSSWMIAVETLKISPLFGVGVGNFLEAFNRFRPVAYNLKPYWGNVFNGSAMGWLQIWTEMGLVAVAILIGLLARILKVRRNVFGFWQVLVFFLVVMLLPLNLMSMMILAWLLSNKLFESRHIKLVIRAGETGFNVAPWLMFLVMIGGVALGSYWVWRITSGEVTLRQSYVAASKNDGVKTYNLQIKAIGENPDAADYRRVYSQTNLGLAMAILANKDMTEDDKGKASTLIQQAVREAKAAIALNSLNSTYWTNLAAIYKQLVGVIDGAADWSLQAYQQAVILDPVNPLLRLDLGGLLFAGGAYEEADRVFEQVVNLKSDFANGWYNYAYTAKMLKKLPEAVQRLTQAVALVPVDSGDYDKASKELEAWKKELSATAAPTTTPKAETLKTPEPLPTVGKEEKVNVPAAELAPPESNSALPEATPVVSPEVTPTPTI